MPAGVDWDDHLIARFRALHNGGKRPFSEIAKTLSHEFGIKLTKNACIGKARRLGLEARPRVMPPPPKRKRPRRYEPPAEVIPVVIPRWTVEPPVLPAAGGRITIYQLKGGVCHYPFGERPPYAYCGNTTKRHSPWCPHHEHVVYPRGRAS
jgi:hypothetical protein